MAYNFKTDTKAQQFIAKYTDPDTNVTGNVYIVMTDNEDAADIDNVIALSGLYLIVSRDPFPMETIRKQMEMVNNASV